MPERQNSTPSPEYVAHLTCTVTGKIFFTPVVINCEQEHVIEEDEAKRLLDEQGSEAKCPTCDTTWDSFHEDKNLKRMVNTFLNKHPSYREQQYKSEEKTQPIVENDSSTMSSNPSTSEASKLTETSPPATVNELPQRNQASSSLRSSMQPTFRIFTPEITQPNTRSSGFLSYFFTSKSKTASTPTSNSPKKTANIKNNMKITFVGNGAVGKTCLLQTFVKKAFPSEYMTLIDDGVNTNIMHDGRPLPLRLCDTEGQEDFDRIRPSIYPGTDIFLLCFTPFNPNSFAAIESKWIPEIKRHCPDACIVLVGTKADLWNDSDIMNRSATQGKQPITDQQAQGLANKYGLHYVTCSALTGGHKDAEQVIKQALEAYQYYKPVVLPSKKIK